MDNGSDKYFKQMQSFQKLIEMPNFASSIVTPNTEWLNLRNIVGSSITLNVREIMKPVDEMNELISKRLTNNLDPIIKLLNEHKKVIEQIDILPIQHLSEITKWNSRISKSLSSNSIKLDDFIPESLYKPINDLKDEFGNSPFLYNESSDIPAALTVTSEGKVSSKKLNWGETLNLTLSFLSFFLAILAYTDDSQSQELINEIKTQNEIQEDELEIQREQLEIDKEKLQLQKKELEHQKKLEEKFDTLTKTIETIVSENPASSADE